MPLPFECASHLKGVADQAAFCQMAAPELPSCLSRVLESARFAATQNSTDSAAVELVAGLETFEHKTQGGARPSPAAVRALWPILESTRAAFAAEADRETPRSLGMDWHSLVNVLAPLHHLSADTWRENLEVALLSLEETEATHSLVEDLRRCLTALARDLTPETIEMVAQTLAPWKGEIARAATRQGPQITDWVGFATLRAVLVIEDQWWGEALEQKARLALASKVVVRRARTLQEALAELERLSGAEEGGAKGAAKNARSERETNSQGDVLVFLDLGLPADEAAMQAGRVSRTHGKELLVRLRDYQINARTIVLTSPSDYLPDHLWISQQGIGPDDFILKTGEEWDKEVDDALERALQRSRTVRQVELDVEQERVWFDGIETQLAPIDWKILSVLSEDLKERPESQRRRHAFSCGEISERMVEYFGEGCDPESIPTHILTLRRAIHARFNEAGRPVDAHRVVATVFYGDEVRYQLQAGRFLRKGVEITPVVSSVSLLVVEDNAAWCEAIVTPLREAGYEVQTAADVAGAITAAQACSPTVLCVDMQLPTSSQAVGDEEGGLRVIESVRQSDPEARIVVLTDLAGHDRLRLEATRRGVLIHDYISKADPAWLWKLHRSIWRLTREWQQGVDVSQGAGQIGHVVELSRSQPRDLWVDGVLMPLSKTNAALLQALATRVDERVSFETLGDQIYEGKGDGKDKTNSLIQVVKRLRKQIEDGLHEAGREANAKHIIAEESGGYIFCGPVLYRD